MSLLVFTPDADDETGKFFRQVLDHLQENWEGTLVLAGCTRVPLDAPPASSRDWVCLPAGMLEPVCRMYEVEACLSVGAEPSGVDLPPANRRLLEPGRSGEWKAELDDWLAGRLGVEILAGPGCAVEEILKRVSRRSETGRVSRVVVRWHGIADETLRDLLERLPEKSGAAIRVELISAHLFDVPRGGLTHSPLDFLTSPDAWKQAGLFMRLVARAPARVEFRVISDSRRGWIKTSVSAANQAARLLRSWLRPGGGS
jgi:hypothetical protein